MATKHEHWCLRLGFLVAAIGTAAGLGVPFVFWRWTLKIIAPAAIAALLIIGL